MSEEVQTPDQEVDSVQTQEVVETPDVNARLLEESKRNKARYQEYKDKYESLHNKVLEQEGDYKKMLENEKSRSKSLEDQLRENRQRTIKANVRLKLSQYAKDAVDVEDLIRHPIAKEHIRFDEETMEIDDLSVKSAIEMLREKKPNYFETKKAKPQMNTAPSDNTTISEKPKNDKDVFRDSLKQLFS